MLDFKRLNIYAAILNGAKLGEPPLKSIPNVVFIQLRSRSQVVNLGLKEATMFVKEVEGDELSASAAADGRNERSREEELAAIWKTPNVAGVVVVVVNRNERRFTHELPVVANNPSERQPLEPRSRSHNYP